MPDPDDRGPAEDGEDLDDVTLELQDSELPDDEIRVHSQDPAEGADPDDDAPAQPRVHSEAPAEGQ